MASVQRWTDRFQIQAGVNWQLLPSGGMSWREWLISPFVNCAWPGRRIAYAETPREMWKPHLIENYNAGKASAKFWWLTMALRVLGVDAGVAIFFQTPSGAQRSELSRSAPDEPSPPPIPQGEEQ